MTRAVTAGEHTNLQGNRQAMRVKVLVDRPEVVFSAQVFAAPTTFDGVAQLPYYNVSVGAYTDVLADMTLLIGSTPGAWDVGVARVRLAPSDTILYIGETSELEVADDDYLTVVNSWEPWAKHPRTSSDILYMDYGMAYTGQHASPLPVPVMGLDAVVELTGGDVSVAFSAAGSWVPGGGAITYAWACSTASGVSNPTTQTPTFKFNTSGRHVVSCTATSGGVSFTGYRIVYVLNDDYNPLLEARIEGLQEDVEAGGTSFDMTVYGDLATIRPGAKVLVFSEDYLELAQDEQSPESGRENMLFSGWVLGESTSFGTRQQSRFEVAGPAGFLDAVQAFPMALQDTDFSDNGGGAASDWGEYNGLTVPAALWHYFMWRTTLPRLTDVRIMTDTRETAQVVTALNSIWLQIKDIAWRNIFARPVCDRYGRVWVEIDAQMVSGTERNTLPVVMAIGRNDMADDPEIVYNTTPEISKIVLTGFQYAGGAQTQYGGVSPGNVHGRWGGYEQVDELMFSGQQQAIDMAGRYYGWRSNPYPEVNLRLAQINKFIDIAPRQYCTLTLAATENNRGLAFTNLRLLPRSVAYRFSAQGSMTAECRFEAESSEYTGHAVAYVFPVIPEPEPPDGEVDPPTPPPSPPPPVEEEPPEEEETAYAIGWACGEESGTHYVWRCDDFNIAGAAPTWTKYTGDALDTPSQMVVPRSNPAYAFVLDALGQGGTLPQIVRAANGIMQVCLTNDLARIKCGTTEGTLSAVEIDQYNGNVFAVLSLQGAKTAWLYFLRSTDAGVSWTASPQVIGFNAIIDRFVVYNNRCWIVAVKGSRTTQALGYCQFGDSMPTVNQTIGPATTDVNIEIDHEDANSVWLSYNNWCKATISGASITVTPKNPVYLGSPKTFSGIGRGEAWINPGDSNHQRLMHADGVFETLDGWSTIAAANTTLVNVEAFCVAGWSNNYNWFGLIDETVGTANLYVYDAITSTTDIDRSVAGVSSYLDYGGFQAGTTET